MFVCHRKGGGRGDQQKKVNILDFFKADGKIFFKCRNLGIELVQHRQCGAGWTLSMGRGLAPGGEKP